MKKMIIMGAVLAFAAMQYSAQATIILSGTATSNGNSPHSGNMLTINYTVDDTAGLYTYTYNLSTAPGEGLTSFTIGGSSDPIFTQTLTVLPGSQLASAVIPGVSVAYYFSGVITGGTVSFTSDYGPGMFSWGVNDLSVTWNNPPLIPAPVPEPATVLAGLLMVVPLGIGAVRAIRKDRNA